MSGRSVAHRYKFMINMAIDKYQGDDRQFAEDAAYYKPKRIRASGKSKSSGRGR